MGHGDRFLVPPLLSEYSFSYVRISKDYITKNHLVAVIPFNEC